MADKKNDSKECPNFKDLLRDGVNIADVSERIASCFALDMMQTARNRCKNPVLAQDAFQEAFRLVLEKLPQFRGDSPLQAWLRSLVVSACSRLRRGRKNSPAYNQPFEEQSPGDQNQDGWMEAEKQSFLSERLLILGQLMEKIPEPNRSLFLLHEGQEHSLQELALRFQLTENAVKGRLKRTREKLRAQLTADTDVETEDA